MEAATLEYVLATGIFKLVEAWRITVLLYVAVLLQLLELELLHDARVLSHDLVVILGRRVIRQIVVSLSCTIARAVLCTWLR